MFPAMSENEVAPEAPPAETVKARFLTWHNSNGDVHIRTDSGLLFVSKKKPELVEQVKRIPRGQRIVATGAMTYSKTLSTHVLDTEQLEVA